MSLRVVQDSTPELISMSPDGTAARPLNVLTTGSSVVPIAPVRSAALESNHAFAVGAGKVIDSSCWSSVGGYYMLFDSASVPADGAVTPLAFVPLQASGMSAIQVEGTYPIPFTSGLVGVFSTTGPFTKTASATASMSARVIQP